VSLAPADKGWAANAALPLQNQFAPKRIPPVRIDHHPKPNVTLSLSKQL